MSQPFLSRNTSRYGSALITMQNLLTVTHGLFAVALILPNPFPSWSWSKWLQFPLHPFPCPESQAEGVILLRFMVHINIPSAFNKWRTRHLLRHHHSKNSCFVNFPFQKKNNKLKGLFLNIPIRSVISSSTQVTSELYNGTSQSSNHIAWQMLWYYYSVTPHRIPIVSSFPWGNLWPALFAALHYSCINPKDALTSPPSSLFYFIFF